MDEDILIPLIVFSFILAMVWMILNHARWKHQHKASGSTDEGKSLRTSELKAMMMEAVAEANRPLHERIAHLEDQVRTLDRRSLPPHAPDPLLEDVEEEALHASPEPARRRS